MPDRYPDFATLAVSEAAGVDYEVVVRQGSSSVCLVAPHGGGIEAGTSEIAMAIAGNRRSFYAFVGLKRSGNTVLHLTSSRFDEPRCLSLLATTTTVVTVHGERSAEAITYVGGLDREAGQTISTALRTAGFAVSSHAQWAGTEPLNVCNRGRSGRGVQLELGLGLRKTFFESLGRSGRRFPTPRFHRFAETVAAALG